jgi:hypothetical protein
MCFRRGLIHEDLEVVEVANLFAGVDVNPDGCHSPHPALLPMVVSLGHAGIEAREGELDNTPDACPSINLDRANLRRIFADGNVGRQSFS